MTQVEEARHALAAKAVAEQQLARMAVCPPWRHAVFAGMVALLVGSPAVPLPLRFGVFVVIFAAIVLVVQSDRRRLGVFINGYRRGKTRMVTFPMLAVILGLYTLSSYLGEIRGERAVSLGLALIAFIVGFAGSAIWQRVFVRELGA